MYHFLNFFLSSFQSIIQLPSLETVSLLIAEHCYFHSTKLTSEAFKDVFGGSQGFDL